MLKVLKRSIKIVKVQKSESDCKAFSDESSYCQNSCGSIGLVSMRSEHYKNSNLEYESILENHIDFKFSNIRKKGNHDTGKNIIIKTIEFILKRQLRIDVLVWKRENLPTHIDADTQTLSWMMNQLFKNVMKERYSDNLTWTLYPDEFSDIDWNLQKLKLNDMKIENGVSVFTPGEETFRNKFNVIDIQQKNSKNNKLIQVADFFAGIATFSHNNFNDYKTWKETKQNGTPLFDTTDTNREKIKNREKKFELVCYLHEICKKNKLSVSLDKFGGFHTVKPSYGMNFWLFESRYELVNAPTAKNKKPLDTIILKYN